MEPTNLHQQFDRLHALVKTNIESADELSKLAVDLVSLASTIGEAQAMEESRYSSEVVQQLRPNEDGKKISVAEAERLADSSTECRRESLKHLLDATYELVNVIKLRCRVLGVEREQTGAGVL